MENKKMKIKQDLLERVRKGELIVENDNKEVISLIFTKHNDLKFYVFRHNGFIGGNYLYDHEFCKPIIKASELIGKEDYTKALQEGIDCIFFNHNESFVKSLYQHYDTSFSREFCHYDKRGAPYKYCFEITGEETINEIQEKINSLLKDK